MTAKGNIYMETALDEMDKINMSENERYLYLRRQMAESDMASMVHWASRQFEEGANKGREEGKIEIILHMLSQNLTCEEIAQLTNLPLGEVVKEDRDRKSVEE